MTGNRGIDRGPAFLHSHNTMQQYKVYKKRTTINHKHMRPCADIWHIPAAVTEVLPHHAL